ncbi:MAG TPA: tRNA uridine-5-carboxymethylaminomethyl(34) synthesis GTPase MnmE [Chlamydiales bacterium]|nr:tRNA uridine-5-carboxymethylaminomethyl(34) synthesis GTPase MnmE [Chlamydiales bacterium]
MNLLCRSMQKNDTIAAISTAPGEGAIAIIRLCGPKAFEIANTVFDRPVDAFASHSAHYGKILKTDGAVIDHVLLLMMRNPRSYTGEDMIEISCHGGSLIPRLVLDRLYEAGARPAEPGEFSLRAFLNGKIDLAQAEAVQQLIAAKSEKAMEQASRQLEGALSKKISEFQTDLTDVSAILEAWVDFPEEGLEFSTMEKLTAQLENILSEMERLAATFHDGKVLHEGISLCLIGSPNVGKSSLMNALLKQERAIVTEIAGTTRDLLEADLKIGGLHLRLIDTAGIRHTNEIVEKEGISRSRKAMNEADLVLLLLDSSQPLCETDQELIQTAPKEKTLIVWNKMDIGKPDFSVSPVAISAKNQLGLGSLQKAIEDMIWKKGALSTEELLITRLRHFQSLSHAIQSCRSCMEGLKTGVSAEFAAFDLRTSLNELAAILGTNVTEDLLSAIFSKFCLGK